MKGKFSSTVAGAAIFLTVVGILSKGLGFLREVIFAGYFGLTTEFDMYLVGAVLPLTLGTIILFLGQNYLIPAANRIREGNSGRAEDFLLMNFYVFIIGGLLLTGILYLGSNWIISLYLQQANYQAIETTVLIFKLYLLTIPLSAGISVLSAYNQFNYQFSYPAYSNLLLNIVFIILIILFTDTLNIFVIPAGFIAGSVLQLLYLMKKTGIRLKVFKFRINDFKKYISPTLIFITLIESIGQLYLLADRYFWNYLPEGGLASLNYAQIIFILPVSILSIALSTAIFPKLAENISRNLLDELETTFNQSIRINITVFMPIMFLLLFYGDYLISILFERGKFTPIDTQVTHNTLIFYSLSLVFYAIYSVANKMLYGLGIVKQLLYVTVTGIILKIILNFLFVPFMQQNGLALSTSVSYIYFTVAAIYLIYRKVAFRQKHIYFEEMYFHLINGFTALIIVKITGGLIEVLSLLSEVLLFTTIIILNIFIIKHSCLDIFSRIFAILWNYIRSGKLLRIKV